MFEVVAVGSVPCRFGVWSLPDEATAVTQFINKSGAVKARIRKLETKGVDWREREISRFVSGRYAHVPWANDITATTDHFVHIAEGNASMVAYTPSEEYGMADRQVRLSPGKYLKRFYGHMGNEAIKHWCSKFVTDYQLVITNNQDEIEHVYVNGPNSCMAKEASSFDTPFHPVRIYGGTADTALAYLKDTAGDIVARAIVWPEQKIHTRLYGDEERLRLFLNEEGYQEGDLCGAKLEYHEHRGSIICPYIDWVDYAEVARRGGKEWLVITSDGDIGVQNTDGYADTGTVCPCCGERCHEDDMYYIESHGESYCESCYYDHTFHCDCCGDRHHNDYHHTTEDGYDVCEYCYENDLFRCDDCGNVYLRERHIVGHTTCGDSICKDCADAYHVDPDTGELLNDDEWAELQAELNEEEEQEAEHEDA